MARNSILCSKSEAQVIVEELQSQADTLTTEFNQLCNPENDISIKVVASQFSMGWGVTAILYFGEEQLKVYPLAELALIDIQSFLLKYIQKHRRNQ